MMHEMLLVPESCSHVLAAMPNVQLNPAGRNTRNMWSNAVLELGPLTGQQGGRPAAPAGPAQGPGRRKRLCCLWPGLQLF